MKKILLLSLGVFVLTLSCTPVIRKIDLEKADLNQAFEVILRQRSLLKNQTGRVQMSVESPEYVGNFQASVTMIAPDSMIFKVQALLGLEVATLFLDDLEFVIYDRLNNELITGDRNKFDVADILKVSLQGVNLFLLFTGYENFDLSPYRVLQSGWENEAKYFLCEFTQGLVKFYFHPDGYILRIQKFNTIGNLVQELSFQKQIQKKGIWLPDRIQIRLFEAKSAISISYYDREVNVKHPETLFHFTVPENVQRIAL